MKKYKFLLFCMLTIISLVSLAQSADSAKPVTHFSGSLGITNNGISIIPTFSLNKPAGIVNLSLSRKKFSFEPDLRFSLSGKPWSFLFWFRYKAINSNKFSLRMGVHPAINFRTENIATNGEMNKQLIARRYLAAEVVPNYHISKNFSIGLYYLNGHGFDKGGIKYSHFITLNSNFSHIKLSGEYYMTFTPQVFYLRLEENEGWFTTATLGIAKKKFPFSLASTFNKELKKGIPGAKDFIWNTTLTWSF